MSPAGAINIKEFTRFGKYAVKVAAMPPPNEYPTRAKPSEPVQGIGDDASTKSICVVKSLISCGYKSGSGVDEYPRPKRSVLIKTISDTLLTANH